MIFLSLVHIDSSQPLLASKSDAKGKGLTCQKSLDTEARH